MSYQTSFPAIRKAEQDQRNRIDTLLEGSQDLYTCLADVLVHRIESDGSATLSREDVESLTKAMRAFTLR